VRPTTTAFWGSAGLLAFSQMGYPGLLAAVERVRGRRDPPAPAIPDDRLPHVTVIVAAYAEQNGIAARVANLRALDYPADRLQVIVASDGSADETVARARAAGADLVLDLPRAGKVRTQDAAVDRATGEILAFSDANAEWEPDALRALVAAFADPDVGYVCGQVTFVNEHGDNQEGLYWRYEMAVRGLESRLRSVTAGNGAIYATRATSYLRVPDPVMGHDLTLPFSMVKRGLRALYVPGARAHEAMVPTIEGEYARKRRFMGHTWPIMLRSGILSPRGYDPLYALMVFSHRALRYSSPFLHVVALCASLALATQSPVYALAAMLQLGVLAAAYGAGRLGRVGLIARYYVLTTAATAAGLWDHLTGATAPGWEPVQEIR
jgi:cellulose synthase/poly-beta-1,6-N-acetylglucosamine synthase-like glycosyltransferase